MGCVRISADDFDETLVADSAHWLTQFYGDLDVHREGCELVLRAQDRSDCELDALWRIGLANERLCRVNRSRRLAALAALT